MTRVIKGEKRARNPREAIGGFKQLRGSPAPFPGAVDVQIIVGSYQGLLDTTAELPRTAIRVRAGRVGDTHPRALRLLIGKRTEHGIALWVYVCLRQTTMRTREWMQKSESS